MIRRLALATTLVTLLTPIAQARAASHMEFALQDDAVFVEQYWMSREKELDQAEKLHAKRIRVNLLWARMLTSNANAKTPPKDGPQYDFSKVDALQHEAEARGIKLQLTLTGPAPAWATKDHKVGPN